MLCRYWRRYIYLWINYALYEELEINDIEKTREVYKTCLQIIPHKKFTFSKIWVMFALFEVRQLRLTEARKIMVRVCKSLSHSKSELLLLKMMISLFGMLIDGLTACLLFYETFIKFSITYLSHILQKDIHLVSV